MYGVDSDDHAIVTGEGAGAVAGAVPLLPSLLRSVFSHPIFGGGEKSGSGIGESETANLEAVVVSAVRLASAPRSGERGGGNDAEKAVHALLIAALSLATAASSPSISRFDDDGEEVEDTVTIEDVERSSVDTVASPSPSSDARDLLPLQTGAVLSLLGNLAGVPSTPSSPSSALLSAELLAYLQNAAETYEERDEIRRERAAARLARKKERIEAEKLARLAEKSVRSDIDLVEAAEKDYGDDDGDGDEGGDGMDASCSSSGVVAPASTPSRGDEDGGGGSAEVLLHEAAPSAEREGSDEVYLANVVAQSSSEDDQTDEGGGEDREETVADNVGEASGDVVGEYDAVSSSSSASSSSDVSSNIDEADDVLEEEGLEDDEADEEGAMLAQALALSLADHSAVVEAHEDVGEARLISEGNAEDQTVAASNDGPIDLIATRQPPLVGTSADHMDPAAHLSDEGSPIADDANDNESLPPLPTPPPAGYPYNSLLVKPTSEVSISPHLDPNALHKFGALPLPTVLLHLIRSAQGALKSMLFSNTSTARKAADDIGLASSCPVGVGADLFPPSSPEELCFDEIVGTAQDAFTYEVFPPAKGETDFYGYVEGSNLPGNSMTIHLLVALFSTLSFSRNEERDALRLAIQKRDKLSRTQLDEEEKEVDDPASHAASPTSRPAGSSQDLEAKGLKRKAAAAAHVEALRRDSDERQIESLKICVAAHSAAIALIMKSLRLLFIAEAKAKMKREVGDSCKENTFAVLSPGSRVALSNSIDLYSTSLSPDSYTDDEVHNVLHSGPLRREALLLWKETIPFLYPSQADRIDLLENFIRVCYPISNEDATNLQLVSHRNERLVKLEILCQRLRHSDLLGHFSSCPAQFNGDERARQNIDIGNAEPTRLQQILSSLAPTARRISEGSELSRLYFALHARAARRLMWDGALLDESSGVIGEKGGLPGGVEGGSLKLKPSPTLFDFDFTKCADSIAIIPTSSGNSNGVMANQRASKVWGTVLGTSPFHPKTGIHRFAVQLDKCERGHVFVGVTTSQASVKTYVGGDKFGWGFIGTQALWHERSKIRGDYGATFRSGATVVVTLDTDAGTLRFGLWKDAQQQTSQEAGLLASPMSLASPRRGNGGPLLEDWGIAFEGLPLDVRLYPAVGLYQRDDKVTLLSASVPDKNIPGNRGFASFTGEDDGHKFYPRESTEQTNQSVELQRVRRWNSILNADSIDYASSVLRECIEILSESSQKSQVRYKLIDYVLPCLASCLCFQTPSIPTLSRRLAQEVLPLVTRCAILLDREVESRQANKHPPSCMKLGRWIVRLVSCSSKLALETDTLDEYEVTLQQAEIPEQFESGCGVKGVGHGSDGRTKNAFVKVTGAVRGSRLMFFEEWKDESKLSLPTFAMDKVNSARVVEARLSTNGSRFEGSYRDIENDTVGKIAGVYRPLDSAMTSENEYEERRCPMARTAALLCQAASRLAANISSGRSKEDHREEHTVEKEEIEKRIQTLLSSSTLLAGGKDGVEESDINFIRNLLSPCQLSPDVRLVPDFYESIFDTLEDTFSVEEFSQEPALELNFSDAFDSRVAAEAGGFGSLSVLGPEFYQAARRRLVSVFLHHSSSYKSFVADFEDLSLKTPANALLFWRHSLQMMESGVRKAVSAEGEGSRKEKCEAYCKLSISISNFLLQLPETTTIQSTEIRDLLVQVEQIYVSIQSEKDLAVLQREMNLKTRYGIAKCITLSSFSSLISNIKTRTSLEALVVSMPGIISDESFDMMMSGRKLPSPLVVDGNTSKSDVGFHYLDKFKGCSSVVQRCVRQNVHGIYEKFARAFVFGDPKQSTSSQTLMLSILSSMMTVVRPEDYNVIVGKSDLVDTLSTLLSHSRSVLTRSTEREGSSSYMEESSRSFALLQASDRSTRTQLGRSSLALIHMLAYQVVSWSNSVSIDSVSPLIPLLDLLQDHLDEIFGAYKRVEAAERVQASSSRAEKDWEVCIKTLRRGVSSPTGMGQTSQEKLEIDPFLLAKTIFESGCALEQSKSWSGPLISTYFLQSSLSQEVSSTLNILYSITRSDAFVLYMASKQKWVDCFLNSSGLSETNLMPVLLRFQVRSIRLLMRLMPHVEPDLDFLLRCFCVIGQLLCGQTACDSIDCAESRGENAASTVVSLLRHLYTFTAYRLPINGVMSKVCSSDDVLPLSGMLAFLGGIPGNLCEGSFVLLKPSTAGALTAVSASHTKASSIGTGSASMAAPPAVVGSEAIVMGLSRRDAMGGMVSSIDASKATCEVVIFQRYQSKVPSKASEQSGMTVRAVRALLSDVVSAEEMPILFDSKFEVEEIIGTSLLRGVEQLLSCLHEEVGVYSTEHKNILDERRMVMSILSLRASLVVLSDKRLLLRYVQESTGSSVALSKLLNVASSSASSVSTLADGLSSTPHHEGQYLHLRRMLAEVVSRQSCFRSKSFDHWKKKKKQSEEHDASYLSPDAKRGGGDEQFLSPSVALSIPSDEMSEGNISGILPSQTRRGGGREEIGRRESQTVSNEHDRESNENDDDANDEEATHLREAAIVQMAELGLPRSWAELALRRTGGTNIEAAVHFCLERGGDMERLLAEERERVRRMNVGSSSSSRRRNEGSGTGRTNFLIQQLAEMGFPSHWCAEAIAATGTSNVDEALTWILTNGERLSAQDSNNDEDGEEDEEDDDEHDEHDDDDDDDDGDDEEADGDVSQEEVGGEGELNELSDEFSFIEDGHNVTKATDENCIAVKNADQPDGWCAEVMCPVQSVSGRSKIDQKTLEVTGLPTGGFSSVGTKGVLLTSGKWYYEAILITSGCLQIGWADASFAGHCQADRGDGCGDGPSSWAFDGWRRYRWHSNATEWGCRWQEGDVIGCLVDMDNMEVSFTLNGKGEEIGMGVAFTGSGFRPCGGVYACVSFNRRERIRLVLGGLNSEKFKYAPPVGYAGVGDAVFDAVGELQLLMRQEDSLFAAGDIASCIPKKFLCDYSEGEHGHELFAWQHRYYGSDASVHLGGRGQVPYRGGSKRRSRRSSNDGVKGSSSLSKNDAQYSAVNLRLDKAWARTKDSKTPKEEARSSLKVETVVNTIDAGYEMVIAEIKDELSSECVSLGVMYSRKLILHLIITLSEFFRLGHLLPEKGDEEESARKLWRVIEKSCSLSSAGWVGEAGAMAVAAEALGLGISSQENLVGGVPGVVYSADGFALATGGISQTLSTIRASSHLESCEDLELINPSESICACAEASLGSDGGGSLVFLRNGLRSAVANSSELRKIFVAATRRSVRILAAVESETIMEPDDDADDNYDEARVSDISPPVGDTRSGPANAPDARLASFLTGLLLSDTMKRSTDSMQVKLIAYHLFEAWSVGLLSASAPWRMVSALTASGILNLYPGAMRFAIGRSKTIEGLFRKLDTSVARRIWAERASVPISSRYVQSYIELLSSTLRANDTNCLLPSQNIHVDAATPMPISNMDLEKRGSPVPSWEWEEGFICSDLGFETWTGYVEIFPVEWQVPSRSAVRSLMDGGEGPPMLREGCQVVRSVDWNHAFDDGQDVYDEAKKAREILRKAKAEEERAEKDPPKDDPSQDNPTEGCLAGSTTRKEEEGEDVGSSTTPDDTHRKKKRIPNPKLPIGTVLSIEAWGGIPGHGRRVKWHLTGKEGIYRYGGDGGRYDISHVEVNDKETRIRKRHPHPESSEQRVARYGFGKGKCYNILLRLRNRISPDEDAEEEFHREGILEWPDFGAAAIVDCRFHSDGAMTITERELLYGSKDSGWEPRFGQPVYVPSTSVTVSPTTRSGEHNITAFEELLGASSYVPESIRDRKDGGKVRVTSEIHLIRNKRSEAQGVDKAGRTPVCPAAMIPPILFDKDYHASSIALSCEGQTATCINADGRGTAFASIGFMKGVHYWEVKIERADIGSVFIGVAEKPKQESTSGPSSYSHDSARLSKWHGMGFVNFRATYASGAERVYGAHCHAGDTVGVLLDCDTGRVSFFFDGVKYGEHILNDLGCAFENVSPFGFNADGCGGGGAGTGAPSGVEGVRSGRYPANGAVRPKALWPVIGLRTPGDKVTLSGKWMTSLGVDGVSTLRNIMAVDCILSPNDRSVQKSSKPRWFVEESYIEHKRWQSGKWLRSPTRGSGPHSLASIGLDVDLDSSALACASACASLGLKFALLSGDRVIIKRSSGRILELAEEAIILGAYQGRLFYQIVSQKSEGGALSEGGGRAWFWDESEVVDGGLQIIGKSRGLDVDLPLLERFKCSAEGGLRIVYAGGAVIRSDLEIFDGVPSLGTIPKGTIVPKADVLERRVNSCGVVRYRIRYENISNGWISSRIRGGNEEHIIELLDKSEEVEEADYQGDDLHRQEEDLRVKAEDGIVDTSKTFFFAYDAGKHWLAEYAKVAGGKAAVRVNDSIDGLDEFELLMASGVFFGMSEMESDSFLVSFMNMLADHSRSGDANRVQFCDVVSVLTFMMDGNDVGSSEHDLFPEDWAACKKLVIASFEKVAKPLPPIRSLLARISMLRALNRRVQFALPWLPLRPSQENSSLFGGLSGFGASPNRAGRSSGLRVLDNWVQVPTLSERVRASRQIIFSSVKRSFLDGLFHATTTPTPLAHDEYELPREVRTVRVNRLKARRAMESDNTIYKKKHSVFSQLQHETRSWSGAALRRGYVAKGHGGQKRAFKVKLVGEGVNDYSGPYREVFSDIIREMTALNASGKGALGVLEPTPNNETAIGEDRELYAFASRGVNKSSILSHPESKISPEEKMVRNAFAIFLFDRNENLRETEESLFFLGRLVGTACRHSIPVDLSLPLGMVWKHLTEDNIDYMQTLNEMDTLACKQMNDSSEESKLESHPQLVIQRHMLNSFVDGLNNVLPMEIMPIFSAPELRDIMCGSPDIDVDLLRRVTEYEGYRKSDPIIAYFWEVLGDMTRQERRKFLQFVWARTRLPTKESDFESPFKIQRDTKCSDEGDGDDALPTASTCFFSLSLPQYKNKDVLEKKLRFAIENVTTMESDYVTNDAEIEEGWRGL